MKGAEPMEHWKLHMDGNDMDLVISQIDKKAGTFIAAISSEKHGTDLIRDGKVEYHAAADGHSTYDMRILTGQITFHGIVAELRSQDDGKLMQGRAHVNIFVNPRFRGERQADMETPPKGLKGFLSGEPKSDGV
jgi:hypothetical protein